MSRVCQADRRLRNRDAQRKFRENKRKSDDKRKAEHQELQHQFHEMQDRVRYLETEREDLKARLLEAETSKAIDTGNQESLTAVTTDLVPFDSFQASVPTLTNAWTFDNDFVPSGSLDFDQASEGLPLIDGPASTYDPGITTTVSGYPDFDFSHDVQLPTASDPSNCLEWFASTPVPSFTSNGLDPRHDWTSGEAGNNGTHTLVLGAVERLQIATQNSQQSTESYLRAELAASKEVNNAIKQLKDALIHAPAAGTTWSENAMTLPTESKGTESMNEDFSALERHFGLGG